MIWHPHIWRETACIRPFSASRGTLRLPSGGKLEYPRPDGCHVVWAMEDLLAGGIWRSAPEKASVVTISCERCRWCGTERVTAVRCFTDDLVLTPEQVREWLDIVQRRYESQRYNGTLYAYGMSAEAIFKRADPSGKNARHHCVYTGPR